MVASVISQPTSAVVELNAIIKIYKYKRFHERHYFIPMAMKVHDTLEYDMDCFIRECARLFHNRKSKGHLSFFFAFNFLGIMLILNFNMF